MVGCFESPLFSLLPKIITFFLPVSRWFFVHLCAHRRKLKNRLKYRNSKLYLISTISMDLLSYIYVHEYSVKCTWQRQTKSKSQQLTSTITSPRNENEYTNRQIRQRKSLFRISCELPFPTSYNHIKYIAYVYIERVSNPFEQ